jgi:cephalosporin hydroxylase
MKISIDTCSNTLHCEEGGEETATDLYSDRGFEILSDLWLKVGWNQKYPYTFSWLGRPIIQAPEDIVRTQEVFWQVKPTVVIETGVAHGGSLVFSASLMKAMDIHGRVIGIDIEIRPHNRKAIEDHPLSPMITLIEGSSTSSEIVAQAAEFIKPDDRVMVILDSNHTKAHVARELELYHPLVTPGSYIVATDGSMRDLHDVPRGNPDWTWDHPAAAAAEFAAQHADFILEQPPWPFNESSLSKNITHWPDAWLKRTHPTT